MSEAFIIDYCRTPFGRYGGALAPVRPDDLGAIVLKALRERHDFDPALIDDFCFRLIGSRYAKEFEMHLFGAKTACQQGFAELEALKNVYMSRFSLVHVLTREPRDLPLLSARPEGERVGQLLDAFVDSKTLDHAYLCGPLPLIEQFREALLARGLSTKQVHLELFGVPTAYQPKTEVVYGVDDRRITVISQGREQKIIVAQGQNILDAALEAGANVPFACKGGVCATCKAKLLEGEADMAINYGLEDDEVAAGYILTCQAHVKSDTAVVDFDV